MEFRYSRKLISLENLSIFSIEHLVTKIIVFFNILGSYGEKNITSYVFEQLWNSKLRKTMFPLKSNTYESSLSFNKY